MPGKAWITRSDLVEFKPEQSFYLVRRAWKSLLRHGTGDGLIIQTASGMEWNTRYLTSDLLVRGAQIDVGSFLRNVDNFIAANHRMVGEKSDWLLLSLAEHLKERLL